MLQKNVETISDDQGLSEKSARSRGISSVYSVLVKSIAQIVLMAVVLAIAFAATMRLVNTKPEVPKRPIFPTVYTVESVIAKSETLQPKLTVYGEVVAGRSVELRSLVSGEIIAVGDKLKSGGTVEKGDMLLEIDAFNFEGDLREAKSNQAETVGRIDEANARVKLEESRLKSGREQLDLAKSDLARIEQLRSRGAATEKQVEDRKLVLSQREQAVEQSEINLIAEKARISQLAATADRLEWRITQAERNLQNTRLVAPFSGTIRSSSAEVGKLTNVNDIVVSMYQSDSLEARFVLTDERFGRLQADRDGIIGRQVRILWSVGGTDFEFPGVIDRIGAEIASTRGGVEVFATVDSSSNPIAIRPGAFVEIELPDRTYENHYRLPDASLYHSDTVYIINEGVLVERKVKVAAFDGDDVLVSEGLSNADEVLVTRISEISAGLKVRKEGDPVARDGRKADGKKSVSPVANTNDAPVSNGSNNGN